MTCVICKRREARTPITCDPCTAMLSVHLREIAELALILPLATAPEHATEEGAPIRFAVVDLTLPPAMALGEVVRDEHRDQTGEVPAVAILDSWARTWAEDGGWTLPAPTIPELVRWLRDHDRLNWARREFMGIDDMAREVRSLLSAMRRALHVDRSPIRYAAPCPYCGTATLRRAVADDWIECGDCGRLWGESEYGLLALRVVADDQLLTTGEAAIVARVEPSTIRSWAHRGRLVAADSDERGRPRYRHGDVRSAVEWRAA